MSTKKQNLSITITADTKNRIAKVKKELNYDELFTLLLDSLDILERTAKGEIKAELQIKKFLIYGHDTDITPSLIRKWTGVNLNLCKRAIGRYNGQIEAFNDKIK